MFLVPWSMYMYDTSCYLFWGSLLVFIYCFCVWVLMFLLTLLWCCFPSPLGSSIWFSVCLSLCSRVVSFFFVYHLLPAFFLVSVVPEHVTSNASDSESSYRKSSSYLPFISAVDAVCFSHATSLTVALRHPMIYRDETWKHYDHFTMAL